jgi:uncharacterized protein (DUF302 family)
MSRQTENLGRAARKLAAKAATVATEVKQGVQRQLRRRRVKRLVRSAGEAAAIAGAAALGAAAVDEANRLLSKRVLPRPGRPLGFEVSLDLAPPAAIARVSEMLKHEGFGVLTRIDAHIVFDEKLGVRFRPYTILGVCNPSLAHRALATRAETGLLLPCNVTLEERPGGGSTVRIADPATMLMVGELRRDPDLRVLARKAREQLARVAEALAEHGEAAVI